VLSLLARLYLALKSLCFLIWSGHPSHRPKTVQECIDSFKGKLEALCRGILPGTQSGQAGLKQCQKALNREKKVVGTDHLKAMDIACGFEDCTNRP